MRTVAVTGAAGSVGRRVVELLAADDGVELVRAFDRVAMVGRPGVETHLVDVASDPFAERLADCITIVHLAEDPGRRADPEAAAVMLERVLDAADTASCRHVVLLSSALVYGARPDNPVPLTEAHPARPARDLDYAVAKWGLERVAGNWARRTGGRVAALRPTTTLSERGVSYIAGVLRAATTVRSEVGAPPVQFLHHDDLASAVALVAVEGLDGVFNVAPDSWIGPDVFRELLIEAAIPLPDPLPAPLRPLLRRRSGPDGLEPYVVHPWVVANDRLRTAGWEPAFTNEEAFVAGNPAPGWRVFALRRRQELALSAIAAATLGLVAGAGLTARHLLRIR